MILQFVSRVSRKEKRSYVKRVRALRITIIASRRIGIFSKRTGLSIQRTLPYGSVEDVKKAAVRLLEAGKDGGYVFAPAHAVEGDVPLENMLAFIDVLHAQSGYKNI
jgi:hypothetical protein